VTVALLLVWVTVGEGWSRVGVILRDSSLGGRFMLWVQEEVVKVDGVSSLAFLFASSSASICFMRGLSIASIACIISSEVR